MEYLISLAFSFDRSIYERYKTINGPALIFGLPHRFPARIRSNSVICYRASIARQISLFLSFLASPLFLFSFSLYRFAFSSSIRTPTHIGRLFFNAIEPYTFLLSLDSFSFAFASSRTIVYLPLSSWRMYLSPFQASW